MMSWAMIKRFVWVTVFCILGTVLLHMYSEIVPLLLKPSPVNNVTLSDKLVGTGTSSLSGDFKSIQYDPEENEVVVHNHDSLKQPVNIPRSEKWVVVGTSSLSDDVRSILDDPEWNVVVVHNHDNRKQPVNIQCRSCHHLNDDTMHKLNFLTPQQIPAGHRNRKLVGYLFAIKHGAKFIQDVGHVPYFSGSYIYRDNVTGIRYNSSVLFNQYSHFGEPTLWPNGFPTNLKKGNRTLLYYLGQWKTPSVQQQLDSVTTFDKSAPPVFLGAGTLALFNTQSNTLYSRDAFWALFWGLSSSPVSQILRGLWIQRLMWEVGETIGFVSPHHTSIHSGNKEDLPNSPFNSQIQKMISFIQQWKCPPLVPFYQCATKLAEDTIQFGVFSKDDIAVLNSWLSDLASLGIREIKRCEDNKFCESASRGKQYPVHFWPNVNTQSVKTQITAEKHLEGIKSVCPKITHPSNTTKPFHVFSNILLIVVFNYPSYYSNIRYLEIMYRAHFQNILYCGEKIENFLKFQSGFDHHVSFLQVNVTRGGIAYRCLLRAMEINYNVDGYLYIGDDTLINTWTVKKLDLRKIWLKFPHMFKFSDNTYWKTSPVGYHAWFNGLRALEARDNTMHNNITHQWKQNIKINGSFYHQFTDIVYIPLGYADRFLYLAEYFSQSSTHVEITVPNLVAGLDSYDNYFNLLGRYMSIPERTNFEKHFSKGDNFLHAVKIGPLLKTAKGTKFFCETYFPLDVKQ